MPIRPARAAPPRALLHAAWAAVGLFNALCIASVPAASLTSATDLNAGNARAEAELLAARVVCDRLSGNSRDACREKARGKELVAKAELDLAHTGTRRALHRVATVKLDTAYDLARTLCNEKDGSAKIVCKKEAQAARTRGQVDLKLRLRMSDARDDAAEDRRVADDKLAAAKCDGLATDARAACLAAARPKAGKT
ncbi:MAG: hypothetical protein HY020_02740 [Burkholderiales bacterium]|nr:hypothetical protein [Burkholderiales bacterium]